MKTTFFYTVMILFSALNCCAQQSITSEQKAKSTLIEARQIQELKNGILLVRLHTSEPQIRHLKKAGKTKLAEQMKAEQNKENETIIRAFRLTFDFCPVYFFLSSDSKKLEFRDYEGIFLNDSLMKDTSIVLPDKIFYIADVGLVYFEALGHNMQGITIMDAYFRQLKRPFPYIVQRHAGNPLMRRDDNEMVKLLNRQLTDFYEHHHDSSPD